MALYDAFYRWARDATDETHNWPAPGAPAAMSAAPYPTLAEATRVWARIALLSFGGPAGQIAVMHRILVEEKRWLGDGRFLHALNFCMLLPGPEAQQLATYIGWLMHGTRGGLIAGILFVLPGVVVDHGAELALRPLRPARPRRRAFFGLKAAVLAIVLEAVVRIGRRTLRNGTLRAIAASRLRRHLRLRRALPAHRPRRRARRLSRRARRPRRLPARAAATAPAAPRMSPTRRRCSARSAPPSRPPSAASRCAPASSRSPSGWRRSRSSCCSPAPATSSPTSPTFFSRMAVVTFGGAYAVLAYVAQEAVGTYGWLAARRDARRPRHGRDHPGPADHGPPVRRLPRRLPRGRLAARAPRRHPRRPPRHLGHLRPLLRLDLPRRALHRGPARQPRALRRPDRGHRRRRRRDPQPRLLVRHPHRLRRHHPHRGRPALARAPRSSPPSAGSPPPSPPSPSSPSSAGSSGFPPSSPPAPSSASCYGPSAPSERAPPRPLASQNGKPLSSHFPASFQPRKNRASRAT